MWEQFFIAFALVLVIEGFFPALNPGKFRQTLNTISGLDNRIVRSIGLISMIAGAVLIYFLTRP